MLRKPKILVVGSFMMDLIASTKRAPNEGETVIGMKFQTAPGGKGANQAVQCARLGADTTMVGKVGNDAFGKTLRETAENSGVDVSNVLIDDNESSGVGHITLEVSDTNAKNRITVCPGANHTLTIDEVSFVRDIVKNYDIVMLQLELPQDVTEEVAKWAFEQNVPVMLNPAPAAPLSDDFLSHITFLSPNEHEAASLSGHEIKVDGGADGDDLNKVADYFVQRGVKNLIVTLGENGSVLVNGERMVKAECVRMEHVADTTAAGDSFVAAFCTGLMAGLDELQALDFASFAAAITVSRMGAMPSLPTIDEVQTLMKERNYSGFDLDILDMLKE